MDTSKLIKPEFMPESGSLYPVTVTLRNACDVFESADRTPDDEVRKDLIAGAVKMLQNVIDALNGRRTDGLVEPEEDD